MEKQKYLYKNPKCVGGTSSTISLINAWLSMTGQRNMQKYRSLAYLGGFTIIAIATIWFLSQSPTYAIEYNSKDKSNKSNKPNKSEKSSNKFTKKNDDTNKSDKRNKSWWSSIREKIANKLGFGKKSKSQKLKTGKPSSSKIGRPGNKNRIVPTPPPPPSSSSSSSSSKTSDVKPNGSAGSSNIRNNTHDARSTNMSKKILRCSNSNNDDARQKGQVTQKIRDGSYGDNSSSNSNNLRQKDNGSLTCNNLHQKNNGSLTCNDLRQKDNGSLTCNNLRQKDSDNLTFNKVKQQSLRKLKLKAQESRPSSNYTNRGNKYRLGDCSISKHPEKVNSTSATRNVKCPSKSDVDNKKSKHHLADMETRISEAIKSINLIDLQVKEKHKEFYIPYTPLTLRETLDKIGQERIERYRKLLIKLGRQKQDDLSLELTLRMVQEFFKERKYYDTSEEGDDDDCHKKRVDNSDDFDDFFKELERTVKADRDNVACDKCPKFADVLAQDEQASRKRIERNLEFLKMIESYKQQGKETEVNIKKSIEMFNEQKAQCKGKTRHLKRPFRFYEELKQFEDRLMDAEQQVKNLAESIDDMEEYFTKTLELFNDDGKMDTAVAKHGPILIDDV